MLICSSNIMCYAKNEKDITLKNTVIISSNEQQLEESIKNTLLKLSNDKDFMDTVVKNYEKSHKVKHPFLRKILNCGFSVPKWILKKVFNIIKKILCICLGITAVTASVVLIIRKLIKDNKYFQYFQQLFSTH